MLRSIQNSNGRLMNLLSTRTQLLRLAMCVFALLLVPVAVYAHAVLIETVPSPNSTINGKEVEIKLRFNARIDSKRSRLVIVYPDSSQKLLSIDQPSPDVLESRIAGLKSGKYALRWRVLAFDGHITQGEIPFDVRQ